ncbi:uncharacterized protein [Panulirus ornatus]|uniref:uncharacterized protein n=1 Tax=Panulirus ornatus TaxID=150431 RepID=UPI003A8792EF
MSDVMELEYKQATAADCDEILDLFSREFYPRESLTKCVADDGKCQYDVVLVSQCIASGVSVVVRDKATGSLIGARTSFIKKRNLEAETSKEEHQSSTESMNTVHMLLEKAKNLYDEFQNPEVDCLLEFDRVCVDTNYCKRGIAKKMVEMSIDLATKKGCQLARALVTSPYTEKLFHRLGFEIKDELDVRKEMEKTTTPEVDFLAIKVMIKQL